MINLADFTPEELEEYLKELGEPKFRAKQIFSWIHKGVSSFDEMTNIPKNLRDKLSERATVCGGRILEKYPSKLDETVKYLIELDDGNIIEAVLMSYKHGFTVCVSTEVGCKMGCRFCASTIDGLVRRLSPGEILSQITLIGYDSGERISNIVLMGIGEPLDNYDNVIKFIRIVNHPDGVNIGQRHISLSTCGLAEGIERLAQEDLGITLCVSLHAAEDEKRSEIMPVNRKYNIDRLMKACRSYVNRTGRRMIFEYSLIGGVNDTDEDIDNLVKLTQGLICHVNLIPVNPIKERNFKSSRRVREFCEKLEKRGVSATVRRELGRDISASCGQLRRSKLKGSDLE